MATILSSKQILGSGDLDTPDNLWEPALLKLMNSKNLLEMNEDDGIRNLCYEIKWVGPEGSWLENNCFLFCFYLGSRSRDLLLFSRSVMSDSLQPMDCSTPGFPVLHHLLEFAQTHVHWVSDAIQPSHPLLPPSPPALNLSQHQGLFQWVDSASGGQNRD